MHEPKRARVDRESPARRIGAADGEQPAAVDEVQARAPERVLAPDPGDADADGGALHRVERVDERIAAAVPVQRVGPPAVRARDARDRVAGHDPAALARIGDPPRQQQVGVEVVATHDVLRQIVRRDVLNQVERPAVGRQGVEREVALQAHDPPQERPARVEDREARLEAEPALARCRVAEHERVAVATDSVRRPGHGDDGNAPVALECQRADELSADGAGDDDPGSGDVPDGRVANRRILAEDA
jgi:hypothetical protein